MAVAASYEDSVVAQLRAQGYKRISVETTLLGRVKISAVLNGGRREIILNPRTGEVLRDLWIAADGDVSAPRISSSNPASGSGNGDTPNSGSGSGNGDTPSSGSGSGNGGGGDVDDDEDEDEDPDDDEEDKEDSDVD